MSQPSDLNKTLLATLIINLHFYYQLGNDTQKNRWNSHY